MKKRLFLLCVLLSMLLLTACKGAEITSTTKFHSDGSGIRTVSAYITAKDAKKMKLTFIELDQMLEEVAPESVNLSRTMQENGDATYEFSFGFSDIEEYNKKIEEITGEEHTASWYTDSSIFKSDISFYEKQCTYDLVKWAFGAMKNVGYSNIYDTMNLYEIGENTVYLEDELVYSGSGKKDNPSFVKEISTRVEDISIYTDFDMEGHVSKKLVMKFNKDTFATVNLDSAKESLNYYSDQFDIDLANATITLSLKNEKEIREFLSKADSNYKEENLNYQIDNSSIFSFNFEFKENYSLEQFLSQFQIEGQYINNYLSLPELNYTERIFYAPNIVSEELEDYEYSGKYYNNDEYKAYFTAKNEVKFTDAKVTYQINDGLSGTLETRLVLNKNGCVIEPDAIKEYYSHLKDFITVEEEKSDDNIVITFLNKFKLTAKDFSNTEALNYTVVKNNMYKKVSSLKSNYDIKEYLPVDSDMKVQYEFYIDKDTNLNEFSFQGDNIPVRANNKETRSLGDYYQEGQYILTYESDVDTNPRIAMTFVEKNHTLAIIIFTIIAAIGIVIIVITIGDLKKNDNMTVLDNWKRRWNKVKSIVKRS